MSKRRNVEALRLLKNSFVVAVAALGLGLAKDAEAQRGGNTFKEVATRVENYTDLTQSTDGGSIPVEGDLPGQSNWVSIENLRPTIQDGCFKFVEGKQPMTASGDYVRMENGQGISVESCNASVVSADDSDSYLP